METLQLNKVEILYPMNEITLNGIITKGNLSYPTRINCDSTVLNKVLGYLQCMNGIENNLSSDFTSVKSSGINLYELNTESLAQNTFNLDLLETGLRLMAIRA